ncbi:2Fe-2S iron-sulfur cluster-binding protein [Streptomyces sp. NPDC001508]|uniref:2Fe-2S iron-sulfur cluster-binding protein n=1 Tax=Streptomyces sp. NPDC001508 TaxID=3154656 RepID=UPI0033208A8E
MTDDQHGENPPREGGRWDPLPQGDYDDGATAFVKLPEGGIDALLSSDSPLAAPGHGYVPPQIAAAPAGDGTDPAGTGGWSMPADGTQWPDPNAVPQQPGAGDRFTYPPAATQHWTYEEPVAPAAGQDVTGQWSIPVVGGDLPDESGEFSASSLVEQWGGTPPATLPGGAPAPWATETAGQPWEQQAAPPGQPAAPPRADGPPEGGAPHVAPQRFAPAEPYQDAPAGPGEAVPGADGPTDHAPAGHGPVVPAPAGHGPADRTASGHGTAAHGTALRPDDGHEPVAEHAASQAPPEADAPVTHETAPVADETVPVTHETDGTAADTEATGPAADHETTGSSEAPGAADGDEEGPDGAAEPPAGPESPDDTASGPHGAQPPATPDGPAAPAEEAADAPPPPHDDHPLASYVLRVNGTDRPVTDAWIGESLLYVLRERLGLAGAKDGCSQGECGACNVQVDGRLVASCLVPAVTAAGSEVRTVEGLAVDGRPSDVQRALARRGAVQCGFCVPGMAMTVHDLLEGNPAPTELEARQALCGNLCRCSGYRGVLDAVKEVVAEREAHSAADAEQDDADGARIPHQAGPGAGGVHASAFETRHAPGPHDQPYGQDGGQA